MTQVEALVRWGACGCIATGLLTALLPCPLTTLAAATLLAFRPGARFRQNVGRAVTVVAGTTSVYVALAVVLGYAAHAVPAISVTLPALVRPFLAPLLLLAGAMLTGVFPATRARVWSPRPVRSVVMSRRSYTGMYLLGVVLALAFCPATAGLFFGVLIPLSVVDHAPLWYAICFGLGYGIPMIAITSCLAAGFQLESLRSYAERWTSLSGWALIALGGVMTFEMLR